MREDLDMGVWCVYVRLYQVGVYNSGCTKKVGRESMTEIKRVQIIEKAICISYQELMPLGKA